MVHFLEWFSKKKQKTILDFSLEHLKKVKETVNALYNVLLKIDDKKRLMTMLHDVAEKEHQADEIQTALILEIAKDRLVFSGYEDLMEFVQVCDSIADYAHTAERYIALFPGTLTHETKRGLLALADIGCKSIAKLYATIDSFSSLSKEEILSACKQIEKLEEKADDEKRKTLQELLNANYTPAQMIVLRDLTEAVEDVCDMCEIAAGKIRILTVKLK
jgi:predicted phosphate transport protein (TIGR00153 family)